MFALVGLLGAVMAGFLIDALTSPVDDQTDEDDPPAGADEMGKDETGTGDLLDDPGAANDPVAGMPMSDDLAQTPDTDQALLGDADDNITAGQDGDDTLTGAGGGDQLGGYAGADRLDGGMGADWLYGAEGADTLTGSTGSDDLHGGPGADDLAGDAGDDSLSGDAGGDLLDGGSGADTIIGGEGMDSLLGQAGNDALQGGTGADQLVGGFGADTLDGNDGNDTIWGDRAGLPWAEDETGQTGVSGIDQVDFLNGGAGDDVLHVSVGNHASGGTGSDIFALHDIGAGQPLAQIMDFNRAEDSLILQYDANLHTAPQITVVSDPGSPDVTVLLDGVPVAQVRGGAGLTADDVVLQAA